ncbi:MAG: DUF2442 domain-containing protein [Clostridiales bacterium]|nr:DUF2442 domain-containing protein [Clostridiales bacterium]
MSIIEKVIPFEDYRVLVELGNGNAIILNFETKLNTVRFNCIENKDIFRKVYTDGYSILWNGGKLRVSIGEMMEILQDTRSLFKVV